jgi:hypothetical protein
MVAEKFDPGRHLIKLANRKGGGTQDYLPVAARVAWFRDEHPDGEIVIEAHTLTAEIAIFKARAAIPGGGSAEGWGTETPQDFRDYIEKASTKALGRALINLGYGTLQAGEELDEGDAPVDAPQASSRRGGTRAEAAGSGDAFGPDLGWTEFWSWARKRGYKGKHEVAVALGKDDAAVNEWTPAQMRTALEVAQQAAG